jgi:hypothetical protein
MVNSSLIGVEKQGLSLSLSAARDGTDRAEAGSLCYFHAVASSLWGHSSSFLRLALVARQSGKQCSIGFQPVLSGHVWKILGKLVPARIIRSERARKLSPGFFGHFGPQIGNVEAINPGL